MGDAGLNWRLGQRLLQHPTTTIFCASTRQKNRQFLRTKGRWQFSFAKAKNGDLVTIASEQRVIVCDINDL